MVPNINTDKYRDAIITDLKALIAIPSVRGEAAPGKPFGAEPLRALEFVLEKARDLGFSTKNLDGYVGHAEYGDGEEYVGILVHLDVVPAGNGWTYPAFEGTEDDGKIYGRGASDNKGPAVAALYCLRAVADSLRNPSRRIRVIFGTNEESGFECVNHYFEREPYPSLGFSPDSGYPIYNREKGITNLSIRRTFAAPTKGGIVRIEGGDALNKVPDRANATFAPGAVSQEAERSLRRYLAASVEDRVAVERASDDSVIVRAFGESAHGANPTAGRNAVAILIDAVLRLREDVSDPRFEELEHLRNLLGFETGGESLGIACTDEESGALTANWALLDLDESEARAEVNVRYPVTKRLDELLAAVRSRTEGTQFTVTTHGDKDPLFVQADSQLIQVLSRAYEEVTGERAELKSMGGGTYARFMGGNGVAFGARIREIDTHVHQPDEFIVIDDLMQHARISARAMYLLATL